MLALIQICTVNLTQGALAFDVAVQHESICQRLKQFFRYPALEIGVVAMRVTNWLELGERWVLCLGRTNWQLGQAPINLLVLSVAWRGVSVPLLWMALDKKSLSSGRAF